MFAVPDCHQRASRDDSTQSASPRCSSRSVLAESAHPGLYCSNRCVTAFHRKSLGSASPKRATASSTGIASRLVQPTRFRPACSDSNTGSPAPGRVHCTVAVPSIYIQNPRPWLRGGRRPFDGLVRVARSYR